MLGKILKRNVGQFDPIRSKEILQRYQNYLTTHEDIWLELVPRELPEGDIPNFFMGEDLDKQTLNEVNHR